MTEEPRHFTRLQGIAEITPEGVSVTVEANAEERAAIAKAAGLIGLDRLTGAFSLHPIAGGGVRVDGDVEADVTQTCVVSLEPVANRVAETVSVRYVPPEQITDHGGSEDDELVASEAEDVEPLTGQTIDLGRLAEEFMLLGLDPYPRRSGAEFAAAGTTAESGSDKPFAALAALKDRLKTKD